MRLQGWPQHLHLGTRRTGRARLGRCSNVFPSGWLHQLGLFAVTNQTDFAERLAEAVLANRRGRHCGRRTLSWSRRSRRGFPPRSGCARLQGWLTLIQTSSWTGRSRLPEQVASQDKRGMIVAFDEFQEVQKLGGVELLKRMRAHFQRQRSVGTSSLARRGRIAAVFGAAAEPFYHCRGQPPATDSAPQAGLRILKAFQAGAHDLRRHLNGSAGGDRRAPCRHHARRQPRLLRRP